MNYIMARKAALIITLILLIAGSIAYFGTGVAVRNDKMMYEKIYGENATSDGNGDGNDYGNGLEIRVNSQTNASQEKISGKRALV
jgi:hypothetical protein